MLGVVSSMSDDSCSLNTDTPLSDCVSLQMDRRITSLASGPLNPQII